LLTLFHQAPLPSLLNQILEILNLFPSEYVKVLNRRFEIGDQLLDPLQVLCLHFDQISPEMQFSILATFERYMSMFTSYLSNAVDIEQPLIRMIRRDVNRLINLLVGEPASVVRVCEKLINILETTTEKLRIQIMLRISNFTPIIIRALNVPANVNNHVVEFKNRNILFQSLELLHLFLIDNERNQFDLIEYVNGGERK
jgi:hypothetical protein